jgi:hypothetical protein
LENTPRDHESLSSNLTGPSSHSYGQFPPNKRTFSGQGASFATGPNEIPVFHSAPMIPKFHEGAIHGRTRPSPEILTFRLLCPSENVGNLIGKGGSIIKTMQHETASEIKVIEPIPGSEDCIIVISGPAVLYKFPIFSFVLLVWSRICFSLMLFNNCSTQMIEYLLCKRLCFECKIEYPGAYMMPKSTVC